MRIASGTSIEYLKSVARKRSVIGIAVIDALHVAAAHLSRCAALVTTEKPTKPIFRTSLVRVVGISTAKSAQQSIHRLLRG
jgi:hypothetical protein